MNKLTDNCAACCKDLESWFIDYDIPNTLMRYWLKPTLQDLHPSEECSYGYFEQLINLGQGKWMVGIRSYDDSHPYNKYPSIEYELLDNITFAYYDDDQED